MIVNLTQHEIVVHQSEASGPVLTIPPSGAVARVHVTHSKIGTISNAPLFVEHVGEVEGLPPAAPDTVYVVSAMVRLAVPDRTDVFSPGPLVRGPDGQPVGCVGLICNFAVLRVDMRTLHKDVSA